MMWLVSDKSVNISFGSVHTGPGSGEERTREDTRKIRINFFFASGI